MTIMKNTWSCWLSLLCTGQFFTLPARSVIAQEQNQDEINPAALRPYWLGVVPSGRAAAPVPPYILTEKEVNKFGGTFGIDLSHYSFDLSNDPSCRRPEKYPDPKCSCSIDWQQVRNNRIAFVYSKATDGASADPSFPRFWADLAELHTSKSLFRGAYHFLRPGIDAHEQAQNFLKAVGAVDGQKPPQLPPVLDIEWSNKQVTPGSATFAECPKNRMIHTDKGYYCDMWYQNTSAQIALIAKQWIAEVEKQTGLPVIIYTNPTAWWNRVMNEEGNALMKSNAVWTSRYTGSGPEYNSNWEKEGGSTKWRMPPIPRGASYPQSEYNVPYFWQFTENGAFQKNFLTCQGHLRRRPEDFNWVPVTQTDFETLFRVMPSAEPAN
jgi:GH25 family lysozyme M1 (1,4-beta-N-acetylmuramidase)